MRGKEEEGRENIYTPLNSSGIPTLIILNENGDVITKNGRGAVMSDNEGQVSCVHYIRYVLNTYKLCTAHF